ncbi:MAG: type II toxin-antitoxin system RatA family toxin [Rickettsiales bacterium]|nr:type II toxin-antitoxin system RatA family toxin [Rickettsiales bacterium]
MPKVSNKRTVNSPIADIFHAVLDVESYPKVLAFVREVKVLARTEGELTARVFVGLPALNFSYDCQITHATPELIEIVMIKGPFKRLNASWKFASLSEKQTEITYSLDSQFSNPLMEMTAGAIFASQLNQSIRAFEDYLRNV